MAQRNNFLETRARSS